MQVDPKIETYNILSKTVYKYLREYSNQLQKNVVVMSNLGWSDVLDMTIYELSEVAHYVVKSIHLHEEKLWDNFCYIQTRNVHDIEKLDDFELFYKINPINIADIAYIVLHGPASTRIPAIRIYRKYINTCRIAMKAFEAAQNRQDNSQGNSQGNRLVA